jgi:hypothetical protein
MKKAILKVSLLLSSIILSIGAQAKDGYKINGTIRNNYDTMVFFCHYFGNGSTVQKVDSARLSGTTATFSMKGDKKLNDGIYMFLFADKSPQIEFMMENGKELTIDLDKTNFTKDIKFAPTDKDNASFYDFKNYLTGINDFVTKEQEKLKECKTKDDSSKIYKKFENLNEDIQKYRDGLSAKLPGTLLSTMFDAMREPIIDAKTKAMKDGRLKDSLKYVFTRAHYWDNWDFKNDKLIYAPLYEAKLENYIKYYIPSNIPDSFNKAADYIMSQVKCGTDMHKYSFWYLARFAGTSKVMGMDESYVYMIEKYLMGPAGCNHLDTAQANPYIRDAQRLAPNVIGKQGKEINIPDNMEQLKSLHNTCKNSDMTVLAFYDPTCGHCEKEVPKMDSTLNSVEKKLGVKIMRYGVQNAQEDEKWRKFIIDKKLTNNWLHLHDPKYTSSYRADYNVQSNPVFYLLDKNGIIRGKRIDHTNIAGLIEYRLKEEKEKK